MHACIDFAHKWSHLSQPSVKIQINDNYLPGVGVTKAPFVNFSVSIIFDVAKSTP